MERHPPYSPPTVEVLELPLKALQRAADDLGRRQPKLLGDSETLGLLDQPTRRQHTINQSCLQYR
jgi:hypothetical protein